MAGEKAPYHHGDLPREIQRTALLLLRSVGVDGLSLRGCARQIGVDPAAVYRHYKSKDAILIQLATTAFADMARSMEQAEAAHAAEDPREALVQIGLCYIDYALREPKLFQLMFELPARLGPGKVDGHAPSGRNAYQILTDAVLRCQLASDPAEVETIAFGLWSTVHGFASLANLGLGPQDRAARMLRARQVCERAIPEG